MKRKHKSDTGCEVILLKDYLLFWNGLYLLAIVKITFDHIKLITDDKD